MNKRAYFKRYISKAAESSELFEPIPLQVSRAYTVINRCLFDDQLRRPKLMVRYLKDAYGICYADLDDGTEPIKPSHCTSIVLNNKFPNKRTFIEVLAHEMVHQYQAEILDRMDHGKTFFSWKEKFARYNLKLRISLPRIKQKTP